MKLTDSLNAWGSAVFNDTLKKELKALRSDVLPIAHVVESGNRLDDSDLGIIVNEISDDADMIYAKVGVFFAEVIQCLTCSGDDGMCDEAYCELVITIEKTSGNATFTPI